MSPTLTRDFPLCHVGALVSLLLELFTEQIALLFYVGWLLLSGGDQ